MKFEELKRVIESDLRLSIESSNGLPVFTKDSSKIESWLQIEAAGVLAKGFTGKKKIIPEAVVKVGGEDVEVDILVENEWAIELKVISNNESASNPDTVRSIREDIEKLKILKKDYSEKNIHLNTAVACFVLPDDNRAYIHENLLSEAFGSIDSEFLEGKKNFYLNDNSVKGSIYLKEI
ncbi:MAG TPA: hypothetical protein PK906_13305 [Spirochaetota bacterium]|mgnify:CR=1 FL=1|nr:hypothetical protein [Spirochaetota bacterium]